jgi:SAM-dependent methyltransferase
MKLRSEAYGSIYEKEEGHWWFRTRRAVLREMLREASLPPGARILDVGCGTGGNLRFLASYGEAEGCDCAEEALEYCARRGFQRTRLADACGLPYEDSTFDLVTCLDVLEHVRLDALAFSELARVTRPGGYVLVTLPAGPRLYSSFDCLCGHLRRYSPAQMRALAAGNGVRVVRLTRYTALAHPVVRLYMRRGDLIRGRGRFRQQMETVLPGANAALSLLGAAEAIILRHWDLCWGSSLASLFQKNTP